jgi:FkbM family methyltransferase
MLRVFELDQRAIISVADLVDGLENYQIRISMTNCVGPDSRSIADPGLVRRDLAERYRAGARRHAEQYCHKAYKWRLRGRERLWRAVRGCLDGYLRARNKYGVRFALDPHDYVDAFVLREGFYENEVFDAIREAMTPGDVFWDVGANAGHHAITLAHLVPAAQVVAFEPSPREIGRIVRSMRLAGVARFEILPFALSDETRMASFHLCANNAGRNSLETWGGEDGYQRTLAQCVLGDDVVGQGYPTPAVIKIDVEGAELKVLKGMPRILASGTCRRVVFEAGREVLQPTCARRSKTPSLRRVRFALRGRSKNTSPLILSAVLAVREAGDVQGGQLRGCAPGGVCRGAVAAPGG